MTAWAWSTLIRAGSWEPCPRAVPAHGLPVIKVRSAGPGPAIGSEISLSFGVARLFFPLSFHFDWNTASWET